MVASAAAVELPAEGWLEASGLRPRPQLALWERMANVSVASCRMCGLLEEVCSAGTAVAAVEAAVNTQGEDMIQNRMHRTGAWMGVAYDPPELLHFLRRRIVHDGWSGWQFASLVHGITWQSMVIAVAEGVVTCQHGDCDGVAIARKAMNTGLRACGVQSFKDTAWGWVCLHGVGHGAGFAGLMPVPPKSSLNFYPLRLNFFFSDSRFRRSRSCDHSCRDENFFKFLVFWFRIFLFSFPVYFSSK